MKTGRLTFAGKLQAALKQIAGFRTDRMPPRPQHRAGAPPRSDQTPPATTEPAAFCAMPNSR
jgi:hypothetical protein